ncbi:MAG: hypothetical protein LAP87_23020 [Acidobacteriia bacterium]|nr:hypothetical protein [Terriglobia bacterium]
MAQDPERGDERPEQDELDASHDLDLVTLYSSANVDAEMEADMIRGVLDSNGIPSILVRATGFSNFGFEVRVPQSMAAEAQRVVAEAQAAGPEAAAEAERESEEGR